jgi:DNA polymerase III delta prime subunit
MEEYSKNCGFIFTCNYLHKIIEPLHSRCSIVEFRIKKTDMAKLAVQFLKRVQNILDTENVQYDKAVVAEIIQKYFPDWRRVLNELQRYSASGPIDTGILSVTRESSFEELISLLKDKNFTGMRKWVGANVDFDSQDLFRKFYDSASTIVAAEYIPVLVMMISKYQYQAAFAADHEINFMAFLVETGIECELLK